MSVKGMRISIDGSTKKVERVLKKVNGETQTVHDFRKYLIKDGVIQPGCHIRRQVLTLPGNNTSPIAVEGYLVWEDELFESGVLEYDADVGALKVVFANLLVENDYHSTFEKIFVYAEEGIANEAYAKNQMHLESAYYCEYELTEQEKSYDMTHSAITISNGIDGQGEPIAFTEASQEVALEKLVILPNNEQLLNEDAFDAYGMVVSFNRTGNVVYDGTEALYIKNLYIVA